MTDESPQHTDLPPLGDLPPVGRPSGLAVPRLRGGCRSLVESAVAVRAATVSRVRGEIDRVGDPVRAGLLGRALAEVVWSCRDPRWWVARHVRGAVEEVHDRYLELVEGFGHGGGEAGR